MVSFNQSTSQVFIIGGTTFDHIVSLPEFPKPVPQTIHKSSFFETTGSTGTGKALCLTKLKVPNTLYSVLGNDTFGQKIIRHLKEEGIDFIYDFDPNGTERHINIMDKDGHRISIFISQSSDYPPINWSIVDEQIKKSLGGEDLGINQVSIEMKGNSGWLLIHHQSKGMCA
jgi:acarbose 7IV-phosphotransferase